ncbi:hypothetical protein D3C87_2123960 [compost metagenome]
MAITAYDIVSGSGKVFSIAVQPNSKVATLYTTDQTTGAIATVPSTDGSFTILANGQYQIQ